MLLSKIERIRSILRIMYYKLIYRGRFSFPNWRNIYIGKNSQLSLKRGAFIKIENNFSIRNDVFFNLAENASVIIGDGVFINNGCKINCQKNIILGNNTLLGEYVLFYDHDHTILKEDRKNRFVTNSIEIESDVWIGSHSVITKGVTIGAGSVIGALNCIRKNVPRNCIVKSDSEMQSIKNA